MRIEIGSTRAAAALTISRFRLFAAQAELLAEVFLAPLGQRSAASIRSTIVASTVISVAITGVAGARGFTVPLAAVRVATATGAAPQRVPYALQ